MPSPRGSLSKSIPTSAIAAANKEVKAMLAGSTQPTSKRGKYHKYSPKDRAAIGKFAAENGVPAARRKYSPKFPYINESTARKFKELYMKELMVRLEKNISTPIAELNLKKRGKPLLLGDKLDFMVQKYIADMRKTGGAISSSIVRAGERGILLSLGRTMLAEFGGPATLTRSWAISLLKRMNNYSKTRATTKSSLPPVLITSCNANPLSFRKLLI